MFLKTVQQAKRFFKILMGFTVLAAGVLMLVTPGPGWVTIVLGLMILSAEYLWARRLLNKLKEKGVQIRDAVFSSSDKPAPPAVAAAPAASMGSQPAAQTPDQS